MLWSLWGARLLVSLVGMAGMCSPRARDGWVSGYDVYMREGLVYIFEVTSLKRDFDSLSYSLCKNWVSVVERRVVPVSIEVAGT